MRYNSPIVVTIYFASLYFCPIGRLRKRYFFKRITSCVRVGSTKIILTPSAFLCAWTSDNEPFLTLIFRWRVIWRGDSPLNVNLISPGGNQFSVRLLWVHLASECEFSSVFYGYYFTISSTTNTTQILQARKTNGIWQQTLRNKQFNIHNKTGMKMRNIMRERHFVEIQLWPVKWK